MGFFIIAPKTEARCIGPLLNTLGVNFGGRKLLIRDAGDLPVKRPDIMNRLRS